MCLLLGLWPAATVPRRSIPWAKPFPVCLRPRRPSAMEAYTVPSSPPHSVLHLGVCCSADRSGSQERARTSVKLQSLPSPRREIAVLAGGMPRGEDDYSGAACVRRLRAPARATGLSVAKDNGSARTAGFSPDPGPVSVGPRRSNLLTHAGARPARYDCSQGLPRKVGSVSCNRRFLLSIDCIAINEIIQYISYYYC